jgi:hypothetical protein
MYQTLIKQSPSNNSRGDLLMVDLPAVSQMLRPDAEIHERMAKGGLLNRFLTLPWFTRPWVYQEVVVAPKVEILWGRAVLPFDFITELVIHAYSIYKREEDGRWLTRLKTTRGFGPLRTIFFDRRHHQADGLEFLEVLWHARMHLDATNDHDRTCLSRILQADDQR